LIALIVTLAISAPPRDFPAVEHSSRVAIESLEGKQTSRGPLRLSHVKRGRFPEERDAVVEAGEEPVIRLKHFSGRRSAGVPPWIEAGVVRDDEDYLRELVRVLAELLPPGGRLMVLYGDDETERGLKRRFPPVVTPIGAALVDAGATWFKDWYFPEGWLEGQFKLQGNLPVSDEAREVQQTELCERVREWLETAPTGDEVADRARERARKILARC
jgi:hypothetical protein